MKTYVTLLFCILALRAHADNLNCKADGRYGGNSAIINEDSLIVKCTESPFKKDHYPRSIEVKIEGYGPGLRVSGLGGFRLMCPMRDLSELKGEVLHGVKVAASVIAGVQGGLFYSTNVGCILYGIDILALGASVSGSTLTFGTYTW